MRNSFTSVDLSTCQPVTCNMAIYGVCILLRGSGGGGLAPQAFRCESMPTPLNLTYILPDDCQCFARMRNSFTSVDHSTVDLSTSQPVILSTCQPVDLPTCRHVDLSICRPADLSTCRPVDMSACQPVDLSTCRPVNLSTCQPVDMSPVTWLDMECILLQGSWAHVLLVCAIISLLSTFQLSTCRPVNLNICQPVDLSTCRTVNLSTCRTVNMSTCQPVDLSPVTWLYMEFAFCCGGLGGLPPGVPL